MQDDYISVVSETISIQAVLIAEYLLFAYRKRHHYCPFEAMELPKMSRVRLEGNVSVFYRYAGSPEKPVLLLIHGYPNSSIYYRDLVTLLSPYYRVIAPDLPGFGFTTVDFDNFEFSFANGASVLSRFLDALAVKKFAMYIFDFGAPWGLRLALQRPHDVTAIISQNGNCYLDGLGKPWDAMRQFWRTNSEDGKEALRNRVRSLERAKAQYIDGSVADGEHSRPRSLSLGSYIATATKSHGGHVAVFLRLPDQRRVVPRVPGILTQGATACAGSMG